MEKLEAKEGRVGVKDVVQRRVGVLGVVGMFYAMCCAGAFGVEEMIPEAGPGMTIAILCILPFVWALPYSLIVAELGSARPVEGGNIIWVKETLGEFWFGVMVIVNFIWGLVANTVFVVLAVDYFGSQWEINTTQAYLLKCGLILVFFVVNMCGIKEVSWTSTVLSLSILGVFILVAVFGFANMSGSPVEPFMSDTYDGALLPTIGAGLALGIWMYTGMDEISLVAGEIHNAAKVIPRALMIVIPMMVLTYIIPTIAGLGSVGQWELWTTESDGVGYHTVLEMFAPKGFSLLFVIVAVVGQCAIYNMCIMVAARSSLILADENLGPKGLAKLTSKKGMPWVSLIIVTVVTWALLGTPSHPFSFQFLVVIDVFFAIIVCFLTMAAAFVYKRRLKPEAYKFKLPGGRTLHTVFIVIIATIGVLTLLLNGTDYFLGGFYVMLIIPVLYLIAKKIWKGPAANDPRLYPTDPRTRLGFGDVIKMGGYYLGFGVFAIIARFFLYKYEEDWGPGYEVGPEAFVEGSEDYDEWAVESLSPDGEDLGDLSAQLSYKAEDGGTWIPGYYETEYGDSLFGNWEMMLKLILIGGIVSAVIGAILLIRGMMLKKNEADFYPEGMLSEDEIFELRLKLDPAEVEEA